MREYIEMTLSIKLHPLARKRHTEVVQLLQVYARLAELEIVAGEKPEQGDISVPESTKECVSEWAEGEETKVKEREELVGELSAAMRARGHDPTPIREAMGG